MKQFMDEDFILSTDTAKKLFHDYAEKTPVLDYHCHLEPKEIAEDRKFKNITELWLGGDHYKWRIMRSNGVPEKYITGDAGDEEKFHAFAKALPKAIGNPMYHWCHLELQRYFDIHETLSEKNWKEIYDACNEKLQSPEMSAKNLIRMSNVTLVCTTDDPIDDLHYHQQIKADKDFDVQVLPAWRPDIIMSPEKEGFLAYVQKLAEVSDIDITGFVSLKEALVKRLDYFVENGCLVTDHGLDYPQYRPTTEEEMAGYTGYCTSKGGADLMVSSMACDLSAKYGINVNCVAPGGMVTPGAIFNNTTTAELYGPEWTRYVTEYGAGVPVAPNPDEIARMILTLCTPVSDFMYGQTVEVDGGSQFSFQDKPWSYTMEGGLHA